MTECDCDAFEDPSAGEEGREGGGEKRPLVVPNWQSHLLDHAIGEMKCVCVCGSQCFQDPELR